MESVESTSNTDTSTRDSGNVTYHTFSHSANGGREKKWTYLTLMPGQTVEVRYLEIDYFAIDVIVTGEMVDAMGVREKEVDVVLQRGIQYKEERDPRTGLRRDLLRSRDTSGVNTLTKSSVCSDSMRLRHGDYILRFFNPTMHAKHVRYNVEVRDDTASVMAQVILLFFVAGVVCPLVTVSFLVLLCYVKTQQYLLDYYVRERDREREARKRR